MATISRKPFVPGLRHLRSDPTVQTLHFRKGDLKRSGKGLAFWFQPLNAAVAEVPLDDRELPFMFRGRTSDFQDVSVQGAVTYRVANADRLAGRIDFAIDLDGGNWKQAPLEQLGGLLGQLAQQFVWDYLTTTALASVLTDGVERIRARITAGLDGEVALADLGLEVVAVRVSDVRPTTDVEQALQTPAREAIQQSADEATFSRRAQAVEKERAISENELQSRIELANRQEGLVAQEGQNERRRREEAAVASKITGESAAETTRIQAEAETAAMRLRAEVDAERVEKVEGARVDQERDRIGVYRDVDPRVLFALAAREAGGTLSHIDHLTITPEMLTPLLAGLTNGQSTE